MRPLSNLRISLLVIGVFLLTFLIPDGYAFFMGKAQFLALPMYVKIILCHGTNLLFCFLTTLYLAEFKLAKVPPMLGLDRQVVRAFLATLLASLPYLIGMLYLHGLNTSINFRDVWFEGIHPGYHEEILYRGFLIGLLVRYAQWPSWRAWLLSSSLFAAGHLNQAQDTAAIVPIFMVAFGAGTGFYLFFKHTGWNLWFPLFLHAFMDTISVISRNNGTILMSTSENLFRGATIAIAILIVYLLYKKTNKVITSREGE